MTVQDIIIELNAPQVESLLEEVRTVMGDRVAAPFRHLLDGEPAPWSCARGSSTPGSSA